MTMIKIMMMMMMCQKCNTRDSHSNNVGPTNRSLKTLNLHEPINHADLAQLEKDDD